MTARIPKDALEPLFECVYWKENELKKVGPYHLDSLDEDHLLFLRARVNQAIGKRRKLDVAMEEKRDGE